MAQKMTYYRPEWTCGRYNREKHAALFYNLIEGMVYFFEDTSADVIGQILTIGRNGAFDIKTIAENNALPVESLIDFIKVLSNKNLVVDSRPTEEYIISYRRAISKWKHSKLETIHQTIEDKLPIKTDDAEVLYLRKVGGITQAMLELTYSCSEKCIHCYNIGATRNDDEKSYRADRVELTLEEYKKIIDQLYDEGCFRISLSGGDPFSNLNVWEIIDYIYNKGIAFDIYTNAQNLVGKVERLVKYYPRLMSISLYADNPNDHDFITRIPGSWNKTISVMEQLGEYAVPMDIKVCIMRSNIKSYRGVAQIARNFGGMALFEASLNDSIDGDKCVSTFLRLTPREYDIILRDPNIGLYVGKEAPEYGKQYHDPAKPVCEGGREAICISPEGNVMPCTSFHLSFGNLKNKSLKGIIHTSTNLKKWLNSRLSDCTECLTHEYCDFCVICPGLAFSEHGNWLKPAENSCYIAKLRYDLACRLHRGEDPLKGRTIDECLSEFPDYKPVSLRRIKK